MRITKKCVVFFCIFSLLFCGLHVGSLPVKAEEYPAGATIEFGAYPQSRVTDEALVAALNTAAEAQSWLSLGYNVNGGSDFAFYKDVTFEDVKYRAIRFTMYRYPEGGGSSADYGGQSERGYLKNTVYWFRFDPISWTVLDPETGLLIADVILDSQAINDVKYRNPSTSAYYADDAYQYYLNDYAHSTVRTWLTETFAETAFSERESDVLRPTALADATAGMDASVADSYGFESTEDAVFLLSYAEAINSAYFSSRSARMRQGTDYAMAQGLNNFNPENAYYFWFLRSPGNSSEHQSYIDNRGSISINEAASDGNDIGICPAVYVSLEAYALLNETPEEPEEPEEPTVSPYDGITFSYEDGILTVSGTGTIPTAEDPTETPFASYADDCKVIVIEPGITSVQRDAFAGLSTLDTLILYGETTLEAGAFAGNDTLETVICAASVSCAEDSFTADESIAFYEPKNAPHSGALPDVCAVFPYSFAGNTLFVEGEALMDAYTLLDLMTVMCGFFDDVQRVRFSSYTSLDVPFYVYDETAESYVRAEDDTLTDVSFSVMVPAEQSQWESVSFNALCDLAAEGRLDSFRLIAETEAGEDVKQTMMQILEEKIQEGIRRVLKWIVGLLNTLFNLLSKLKKK